MRLSLRAMLPVRSPLALITAAVAIPAHVLVSFRIGSLEWPLKGSFFGPCSSSTHQDPVLRITCSFWLLNFSLREVCVPLLIFVPTSSASACSQLSPVVPTPIFIHVTKSVPELIGARCF
jgi:hypothetical protein